MQKTAWFQVMSMTVFVIRLKRGSYSRPLHWIFVCMEWIRLQQQFEPHFWSRNKDIKIFRAVLLTAISLKFMMWKCTKPSQNEQLEPSHNVGGEQWGCAPGLSVIDLIPGFPRRIYYFYSKILSFSQEGHKDINIYSIFDSACNEWTGCLK